MPKKKPSLIQQLQRRKVFQALGSWATSAAALFGILEVFGLGVGLSEQLQKVIMGAYIIIGLPGTIYLSWTFDDGEREADDVGEVPSSGSGVGWIVFAGVAITVVAVALIDPGGIRTRALSPFKGAFFSGATVDDVTGPIVEGGIQVDADISVTLSGPVDPMSASSETVRLLDDAGELVPSTVSVEPGGARVQIDPRSPLTYGASYTVVVEGLRGDDGQLVWDAEKTGPGAELAFRTQPVPADGIRPRASFASDLDTDRVPAGGPLVVEFDGALDPATLESGIILQTQGGDAVEADYLISADNREVRIEPASDLSRGERYAVVVDSTLLASTGLAATPAELDFRVMPAVRPSVTQSRPVTPPASTTGPGRLTLNIAPASAAPFLRVEIDGEEVPLPISNYEIAESRSHTITVFGVPDFSAFTMPVFTQTVTPTPGQRLNIDAGITEFGSIDIVADPAGIAFLDGREIGTTPLSGFPVEAGRDYELEIRPRSEDADSYGTCTGTVRVSSLEWRELGRLTLPEGAGTTAPCRR